MILIKIHKSYREVVAICDSNLIGKKFEQGKFQLDLKESFYKGEEYNAKKTKEIIKKMSAEDATFNIVGEKSIQCAIETGIFTKENTKKIQGIPFALVLI